MSAETEMKGSETGDSDYEAGAERPTWWHRRVGEDLPSVLKVQEYNGESQMQVDYEAGAERPARRLWQVREDLYTHIGHEYREYWI